mgnify:CR=1 FL=1
MERIGIVRPAARRPRLLPDRRYRALFAAAAASAVLLISMLVEAAVLG